MKKYTKISTISIVSVLCAVMVSPVLGASTVRALGGAGTYNSAASASASKNSVNAARAGTMRVGTTKRVSKPVASTTTTSGTRVSGSTTATSGATPGNRLSIGKYLGGSKVTGVSGGVSDEDFAGVRDEFASQLDELQAQHDADFAELQGRVDEMSDAKQDKLTAGDFIVAEDLENNIVTVDSEKLMGEVETDLQEIKDAIGTKAAQTDLVSAKTALESADAQLTSRLDKLESDNSTLSGSLADYAKIQYVDTQNAAQDTNITTNKNNIDANTEFIGNLNSLTTTAKTSTVAAINEVNAKVDANAAGITKNASDIATMDAEYKAADTQIRSDFAAADETTLSSAKGYTDQEIAKISGSLDGATGDLGALTQRVATAEGEIDTLQAEMDAVEAKAAANETNIATNAAAIATKAAQTDLDAANAAIAQNAANIATKADAAATTEALATKANSSDLKALAYKDTVANADIEDGAAIDPNKLALPTDGQERVLYVGTDGKAEWAPVVSTYTAPAQPN